MRGISGLEGVYRVVKISIQFNRERNGEYESGAGT
jgi:hypothetical protein